MKGIEEKTIAQTVERMEDGCRKVAFDGYNIRARTHPSFSLSTIFDSSVDNLSAYAYGVRA